MLSLAFIREHPEVVRRGLALKHEDAPLDEILDLDRRRREIQTEHDNLASTLKRAQEELRSLSGPARQARQEELRAISDRRQVLLDEVRQLDEQIEPLLLRVPNLPHESVPVGASEADNVELRTWGTPRTFSFTPLPHWEIGEKLDILDFDRASKISGPRFVVFKGLGARLERALISWMIDVHVADHGYLEVATPYLVRRECMVGTGQIPKFVEDDDAYHLEKDDLFLLPTAEVSVTNLHREEILPAGSLPIKYISYSACFRREAGSSGRDTRGTVRIHQFDKVEMVTFVEPSTSYDALESLLSDAEDILRRLELPYRVVAMCTADLGFTAAKKYDPEVWLPAQDRYVEISSCSNFEAFQARRANIRYRPQPTAKPEFVHTLNGSGLALSRTLAAILENYQEADGSVIVPAVLRPYMGGLERIAHR